ncbi:MAG: sarcosine oxidase subunit alpha family protein [Thiolinea sp.]
MKRLSTQPCERIDRSAPLYFQWQGKRYQGYAGDTLASAMLANDIALVGRSFKYGRQRGIMAAGTEEANALVTLETAGYHTPNARATETELYDGMSAIAGSGVPSLNSDMRAWLKPFHRFMAAGFYYKMFKWPQKLWPVYEDNLRKLSGFSKAPDSNDAEIYDHQYHHADIAIVGGGPAGLAAALNAANAGASVILVDERHAVGGEMISDCAGNEAAKAWFAETLAALEAHDNVRMFPRTTAYALHDQNLLLALERRQDHLPLGARNPHVSRQRSHRIRAKQVILATGSHERPMMFANNDLPGVMLAGAMRRYLNEYAVLCGDNPVIAGNNDSIYDLAADLLRAGIKATVVDCRSGYDAGALTSQGVTVRQGYAVVDAIEKQGRVGAVKIAQTTLKGNKWTQGSAQEVLSCDALATSGGFSPLVHLDCHTGSKPAFDADFQAFMPACDKPNRFVAGSIRGHSDWQGSAADGAYAAAQAVEKIPSVSPFTKGSTLQQSQEVIEGSPPLQKGEQGGFNSPQPKSLNTAPFLVLEQGRGKTFIDMQNDVKASDIELAIRENYRSIEHIKRYTALGFGTDQGKTGNVNGIAIAAEVMGRDIAEVGTTTFRPMYTPVTLGALAGEEIGLLFDPQRFTPMQASHIANGADFETVGQWMRPWYFPKAGEDMHAAVQRECLATRSELGMMDASTLGKIDIQGPDAREFLARVYTNAWEKLAPGKCRYGLMCGEDGMIKDDGVTACISDTHFLMTTTTGGAASVFTHLETWLQTEWPELNVYLTSVTDHWSTTAVVGPKARRVMEQICDDIDFSAENFPFMDWREGTVLGVPARVMRISFSGELSYEINVQANYGRYIWDKVTEIGRQYNVTHYGTESMHVLRAEKGYIIVGQDTDGSITPQDANMGWAVSTNKTYPFLGQRALSRSDSMRPDRKQLVGLYTQDPQKVLPEGAQLVNAEGDNAMIGHVTSSYMSPILGRSIAMAVVKGGLSRMGETIYAKPLSGEVVPLTIVDSIFYDQAKEKLDGEA